MRRDQGGLWTQLDHRSHKTGTTIDAKGMLAEMAGIKHAASTPPLILHGVPQEFEDSPEQHHMWGRHNNNIGAAFFERNRLSPGVYDSSLLGT